MAALADVAERVVKGAQKSGGGARSERVDIASALETAWRAAVDAPWGAEDAEFFGKDQEHYEIRGLDWVEQEEDESTNQAKL